MFRINHRLYAASTGKSWGDLWSNGDMPCRMYYEFFFYHNSYEIHSDNSIVKLDAPW